MEAVLDRGREPLLRASSPADREACNETGPYEPGLVS